MSQPNAAMRSIARGLVMVALLFLSFESPVAKRSDNSHHLAEQPPSKDAAGQAEAKRNSKDQDVKKKVLDSSAVEELILKRSTGKLAQNKPVVIENCIIKGPLSLADAKIETSIWLNDCEFTDGLDLSDSRIEGSLSLRNGIFDGGVDLTGIQVRRDLSMQDSTFKGSFDVTDGRILGNVFAEGSKFVCGGEECDADFEGLHVGGEFELDGASSRRRMILESIETQFLSLADSNVPEVRLNDSIVRRHLTIKNVKIGRLVARNLTVGGPTSFEKLTVTGEADLRHSQLAELVISETAWPKENESVHLAGLTFQSVRPESEDGGPSENDTRTDSQKAREETDKWNGLLKWVSNADYAPDVYRQLEDALKREGRPGLADETYEEMGTQARVKGHLGWVAKINNCLLHLFVGYGREPQYAFYWSGLVILIGAFVYDERYMETTDDKYRFREYNRFWYSLDVFLPLSGLKDAEAWIPKKDFPIRGFYARIHALLGWVLIPIGVAAISGLISGK